MRIILAALALLSFATPALAQEDGDLPPVTYPDVVEHAATAKGFVPKGWGLEITAKGDLNGDGEDDLALVIRGKDKANILEDQGPEPLDTNPRMLVVALADEDGYALALTNNTLIPRADNGFQADVLSEDGGVTIDRGSVVVKLYLFMSAGGSDTGTTAFRFRFEEERLRLIGFDSTNVNRMSGVVEETSINYLTGKVVTKTGSIESDESKSKTSRLKKKPVLYIEDIDNGLMFVPEM